MAVLSSYEQSYSQILGCNFQNIFFFPPFKKIRIWAAENHLGWDYYRKTPEYIFYLFVFVPQGQIQTTCSCQPAVNRNQSLLSVGKLRGSPRIASDSLISPSWGSIAAVGRWSEDSSLYGSPTTGRPSCSNWNLECMLFFAYRLLLSCYFVLKKPALMFLK